MKMSSEVRTGRHCVFVLHVHLVFVTKYRKKIFEQRHIDYLRDIFSKVCKDFGAELVEMEGIADHVHLLVNYSPKICISKLVNSLKCVSSRRLKQKFPELKEYYWKNALWSPSYFAGSCCRALLEVIKNYIENQSVYYLP
jgi:putative transposase